MSRKVTYPLIFACKARNLSTISGEDRRAARRLSAGSLSACVIIPTRRGKLASSGSMLGKSVPKAIAGADLGRIGVTFA